MSMFRNGGGMAFLILASAFGLRAQDTTLMAPAFIDEHAAATDKPPQLKNRLKFSWPEELEKSNQPSYVFLLLSIDSKGKVTNRVDYSANPYFEKSVSAAFAKAELNPPILSGQPGDSVAWMAVIFNPLAAKENAREAIPRLVSVGPVFVTKKELQGERPPTIWTTFHVDETGAISISQFDDPAQERFREKIQEALPGWKFLPARKAGVAVAADIHVPVQVLSRPKFHAEVVQVPPKVLHSEKPIYPMELRKTGMKGEVLVAFDVSPEGRVVNPVINQSSNPAFDQPALEAVLKWKFAPATRDGKPVAIKMLQPISFMLEGMPDGGHNLYEVSNDKKILAKLPEELRYDVSPKLEGVLQPIYPYPFLKDSVDGRAKVRFLIDDHGKVSMVKVLEATKPEFGLAMVAAVEAFHFIPAMKNGVPTISLFSMESKFEYWEADRDDRDLLAQEKKHPQSIVTKGLDRPLKPLSQKSPIFPTSLAEGVSRGSATIEILIDKDGRTRLPRVVKATEPAFGYSAMQAVTSWRFEVPKIKGEPTVVRVQVPIAFELNQASRPGEGPAKEALPAGTSAEADAPPSRG